jgi:hypothetical protein
MSELFAKQVSKKFDMAMRSSSLQNRKQLKLGLQFWWLTPLNKLIWKANSFRFPNYIIGKRAAKR